MNKQKTYVMDTARAVMLLLFFIINSLMHISRELFISDIKRKINVYKICGF